MDEIDAVGRVRGGARGNDERDQTLNQMLSEMDGFDAESGVIVMAATNRCLTVWNVVAELVRMMPGTHRRHIAIKCAGKGVRRGGQRSEGLCPWLCAHHRAGTDTGLARSILTGTCMDGVRMSHDAGSIHSSALPTGRTCWTRRWYGPAASTASSASEGRTSTAASRSCRCPGRCGCLTEFDQNIADICFGLQDLGQTDSIGLVI